MQINSIIDIVDGELLNSPSISFIYNIKNNPKKVIEGDLFISNNHEEIEAAIKKGAFAIIFDKDIEISDNEIAWVKVKSIQDALIKLFRYKLANMNLDVFYCDVISYKLIEVYKAVNKNIKFIQPSLIESIKVLEELSPEDILFCYDKALLNNIYPQNKAFNSSEYRIDNLIEHSLFETSFSYKETFFSKLKIPSLYLNQFLDVYTYCKVDLDFNRLKKLNSFKPIFVDKFLSVIEFGKSDKFILAQENSALAFNEVKHIQEYYTYAKTIFITKKYLENFAYEQHVLQDINELKEFLNDKKFNCVYIIGYGFEEVEYVLSLSNQNQALF